MKHARTILSLAALATVSACSWMPSMPDMSVGPANTSASARDNNLYGDERTASHPSTPAPAAVVAPVAAPAAPAPAPAPVAGLLTPEPTPAPLSNAEPIVEKNVTK